MNGAPPTRSQCLSEMGEIIKTVDEHAREMNRRWGFNRLPHIVPIEWTLRFKSQRDKYAAACFECTGSPLETDISRVRTHGEAMIRAYNKLEEIALASGMSPNPPGVWGFELRDGTPIILVRTTAELAQVEKTPGAQAWSLDEIANILVAYPELAKVKNVFPEAEVIQMRTPLEVRDALDDELTGIPF